MRIGELNDYDWLCGHVNEPSSSIAEQLGCSRQAVHAAYRRHGIVRSQRPGPEPQRPHGTLAAYRRHFRFGEEPCDACREAQAEYQKGRVGLK